MKSKKQLILLHGALGSKKQFSMLKPLLEEQFELYELDFDGHGEGKEATEYSIELFTKNVYDFLFEKDLKSVYIFGYSMGGYVAINLAIQNPELVNKIATLGTKFDWNLETAKKEAAMLNPKIIEEKFPTFAEKLKNEHPSKDWKNIVKKTANMMLHMGNGKTISHNDLRKLSCEVIVGWGTKDRMVEKEESVFLSTLIPKATFLELENTPHPIDQIPIQNLTKYILDSFKL